MMQQWFQDAKLGIFIHWGIYAVKGISESWSFYNQRISYEDYMKQCDGFTAARYDPAAWADLFRRAGARYAVLTAKHHDGVALFDTKLSDLSVVKATPAGRDLIAPYCEAMRQADLKVGLYFSHLDWSHPDWSPAPVGQRTLETKDVRRDGPDAPDWQRFLAFHRGQLRELCSNYGQIDLLWFDGHWDPSPEYWRMDELRRLLEQWQPQAVINGRMNGMGDYDTPEQGVPIVPPDRPWEFCVTINDSWGYQTHDHNHKSVRQIVRMFAETIGMGGNLLLDVGPMADGTITPEQTERLEGLGAWIRKHEEAVYGTVAGLPAGHVYGASTLARDRETLYVMLFDRPWDQVAVKGIQNKIKRVTVLGDGRELRHRKIGGAPWVPVPGVLWIDVPEDAIDPNATVLKIEMEGPLDLYRGVGYAVESN